MRPVDYPLGRSLESLVWGDGRSRFLGKVTTAKGVEGKAGQIREEVGHGWEPESSAILVSGSPRASVLGGLDHRDEAGGYRRWNPIANPAA